MPSIKFVKQYQVEANKIMALQNQKVVTALVQDSHLPSVFWRVVNRPVKKLKTFAAKAARSQNFRQVKNNSKIRLK